MRAYWNSLQDQERWALVLAFVSCSLFLLYICLIKPLNSLVEHRAKVLVDKRETLAWIQKVRVQTGAEVATVTAKANYLTLISTQLKSSSFKQFAYQLQQSANGDLELEFDEVPYTEFIKWLNALTTHYLLTINTLSIDKTSVPGLVRLKIVLHP